MRLLFTVVAALTISNCVSAQGNVLPEKNVSKGDSIHKSTIRHSEVKKEFDVTNSMFLSNTIPTDLPKKQDYKDNELYFKVIQGYINTHSDLFIKSEVEKLGFTYPAIINRTGENEKRSSEKFRRTEPISENEKRNPTDSKSN